jgi:hypothetical protein
LVTCFLFRVRRQNRHIVGGISSCSRCSP